MARRRPTIPPELLDQLLDGSDPATVFESDGLVDELKRALAERILDAEMDVHLSSEVEKAGRNHRNGHSKKTVLTDSSAFELSIPRDRHGHFEPQLIEKYRRRFPGFDEKIIALYARGMSTRDIQAHVRDLYGLAISPDLVSAVTDSVMDEVKVDIEPTGIATVTIDAVSIDGEPSTRQNAPSSAELTNRPILFSCEMATAPMGKIR